MNIENIQIAHGALAAIKENVDATRGSASSRNASLTETNFPVAREDTASIPTSELQKRLDQLQVFYPPFFPAGSAQRLDLIKGVRNIQNEIVKSPTVSEQTKNDIREQKLTNDATDAQISVARQGIAKAGDELIKNNIPSVKSKVNPGVVLDFKV